MRDSSAHSGGLTDVCNVSKKYRNISPNAHDGAP
jgi:hypothetical protein